MVKKKSASSRQERRVPASALFTTPVTEKQRRELQRLAARPDSQIDFSDAPEGRPRASDIQVGRFYRPIKQLVSLRVDADVLAWFRGQGKKTHMNEVPPARNADKRAGPITVWPVNLALPEKCRCWFAGGYCRERTALITTPARRRATAIWNKNC